MLVKCGWCKKSFEMKTTKDLTYGYGIKSCPHCYGRLRSSKKEMIEGGVPGKHIHVDFKKGEVV